MLHANELCFIQVFGVTLWVLCFKKSMNGLRLRADNYPSTRFIPASKASMFRSTNFAGVFSLRLFSSADRSQMSPIVVRVTSAKIFATRLLPKDQAVCVKGNALTRISFSGSVCTCSASAKTTLASVMKLVDAFAAASCMIRR